MSDKKFMAIRACPFLMPIMLGVIFMFFMFIGCGWLFVAMTFFCFIAAVAIGIMGIIGAYANMTGGVGATLLMLGCGLCALGLVRPLFVIAVEFFKGYQVLSSEYLKKIKNLKAKMLSI